MLIILWYILLPYEQISTLLTDTESILNLLPFHSLSHDLRNIFNLKIRH